MRTMQRKKLLYLRIEISMYQTLSTSLKEQRSIRFILFDLGETLWTTQEQTVREKVIQDRATIAAELLRSYLPEDTYAQRDHNQLSLELRSALSQRYSYWCHQHYDREPDVYLLTTEACSQLGLPSLSKAQALALHEAFREPLPATRQLFDDALTTLHELRARGFLLGCVTDRQYGGSSFITDLQKMGVWDLFSADSISVSADCAWRKPHPMMFQKSLIALQAPPAETAVVGDFLSRDVAGAKRLGMLAIWKPKLHLFRELQTARDEVAHLLDAEALFAYALQQEREWYPGVPMDEMKPFTRPDYMIKDLSDLLALFVSPGLLARKTV